ncbi:MAG: hypothetical protein OZ922_00110 [Myxococcales bacterium]|jgi:hypothetical protein|nr:hypothetical protein [Myxococcales bacterium]
MKKSIVGLAAAVALLSLSTSVHAKTVCYSFLYTPSQMKLTFKPIKKVGAYTPVIGIIADTTEATPVEGSAAVNKDGTISLGIQMHYMTGNNTTEGLLVARGLNANLEGTYLVDGDGDGKPNFPVQATVINCKEFNSYLSLDSAFSAP